VQRIKRSRVGCISSSVSELEDWPTYNTAIYSVLYQLHCGEVERTVSYRTISYHIDIVVFT